MKTPKKTIPAPGNWAFWPYDQYPFLLGGEIVNEGPPHDTRWHRDDAVFIGGYRSYFVPLFCVGPNDGPDLVRELERLKTAYADDVRAATERREKEYAASAFGTLRPRDEGKPS